METGGWQGQIWELLQSSGLYLADLIVDDMVWSMWLAQDCKSESLLCHFNLFPYLRRFYWSPGSKNTFFCSHKCKYFYVCWTDTWSYMRLLYRRWGFSRFSCCAIGRSNWLCKDALSSGLAVGAGSTTLRDRVAIRICVKPLPPASNKPSF